MLNEYNGLLVIIPTRNRAHLAINAILSVLYQRDCEDTIVLVSDNSTEIEEIELLSSFCEKKRRSLANNQLHYVRPSVPMNMGKHWEWIYTEALKMFDSSHFIYLTDRMIFKEGELKALIHLAKRFPDDVISYNCDRVDDYDKPIKLVQREWTGNLVKIHSDRLLYLSSLLIFHGCLPKMLNCIAPRVLLEKIKTKFRTVFDSISPDYCFCYRCLDVIQYILYYDKSVLVDYAIKRSNGASMSRGVMSKDSKDFMANLSKNGACYCAPIPEIISPCNAIIHEYYFVKAESNSTMFPEVDKKRYLEVLAFQSVYILDKEFKIEMLKTLEANGWKNNHILRVLYKISLVKTWFKIFGVRYFINKLKRIFIKDNINIEFNSTEEALEYNNRFPRPRSNAIGICRFPHVILRYK